MYLFIHLFIYLSILPDKNLLKSIQTDLFKKIITNKPTDEMNISCKFFVTKKFHLKSLFSSPIDLE